MSIHPLSGQIAHTETLINVPRLISAYYTRQPDVADSAQRVAFGSHTYERNEKPGVFVHTEWLA